jgi:hypothetical protein
MRCISFVVQCFGYSVWEQRHILSLLFSGSLVVFNYSEGEQFSFLCCIIYLLGSLVVAPVGRVVCLHLVIVVPCTVGEGITFY